MEDIEYLPALLAVGSDIICPLNMHFLRICQSALIFCIQHLPSTTVQISGSRMDSTKSTTKGRLFYRKLQHPQVQRIMLKDKLLLITK